MKKATALLCSIVLGGTFLIHGSPVMAGDMSAEESVLNTIVVLESVPVSFEIDREQYSVLTLEDIGEEAFESWSKSVDTTAVEDGFVVLPAEKTFSDTGYHLIVYEAKGYPDAYLSQTQAEHFEKGYRCLDFMDISEWTPDVLYQEFSLSGMLETEEKYYYTDEACFFLLKNLSGKDGSLRLITFIDGYSISISAFLDDPDSENQMKAALYSVADSLKRGDQSGTLAAEIRTAGLAKNPTCTGYIAEMPAFFQYDQDKYNVLTNFNMDEASVSIERLGISDEKAREFMQESCLLVTPADDSFEDNRIALLMYPDGKFTNTGGYLREGTVYEKKLRYNLKRDLKENFDKEYIAANGQIYLGYEEPYTTETETIGVIYYYTVWKGNLIITQCQYDLSDEEDYHEAAEELVKSTLDSLYDRNTAVVLPECHDFCFGFANSTDGSNIIPVEYGYTYIIKDHALVERGISDFTGKEETIYYHTYTLAGLKENQNLEETQKCLSLSKDNAIYRNPHSDLFTYDEDPVNAAKTGKASRILTMWKIYDGGKLKRLNSQEIKDIYEGTKIVDDCPGLYSLELFINTEGKLTGLKLVFAPLEDAAPEMSWKLKNLLNELEEEK